MTVSRTAYLGYGFGLPPGHVHDEAFEDDMRGRGLVVVHAGDMETWTGTKLAMFAMLPPVVELARYGEAACDLGALEEPSWEDKRKLREAQAAYGQSTRPSWWLVTQEDL